MAFGHIACISQQFLERHSHDHNVELQFTQEVMLRTIATTREFLENIIIYLIITQPTVQKNTDNGVNNQYFLKLCVYYTQITTTTTYEHFT